MGLRIMVVSMTSALVVMPAWIVIKDWWYLAAFLAFTAIGIAAPLVEGVIKRKNERKKSHEGNKTWKA